MRVVRLVCYLLPLASVAWRGVHRALQSHIRLRLTEEIVAAVHLLDGLQGVRIADVLLSGGEEILLGLVVRDGRWGDRGYVGVWLAMRLHVLAKLSGVEVLVLAQPLPVDLLRACIIA